MVKYYIIIDAATVVTRSPPPTGNGPGMGDGNYYLNN